MPEENIITKYSSCVWVRNFVKKLVPKKKILIRLKILFQHSVKHSYDSAEKEFGKSFVDDVKAANNVLWMFLPFPVFWALFDQQGSLWLFQARRMNGVMTENWIFLPDQIQFVNPFLILAFIPLFECKFPHFALFNIINTLVNQCFRWSLSTFCQIWHA